MPDHPRADRGAAGSFLGCPQRMAENWEPALNVPIYAAVQHGASDGRGLVRPQQQEGAMLAAVLTVLVGSALVAAGIMARREMGRLTAQPGAPG